MMKKALIIAGIMTALFLTGTAHSAGPDDILGRWWNQEGTAQIEIYKENGTYHGKIVFLKDPVYPPDDSKGMAGKTKVDRENPDPTRRNDPLLGMVMIRDFSFSENNLWENGSIYDPKNGKTYRCKLTLKSPEVLNVRGYIGISWFGRTTTWTRVK